MILLSGKGGVIIKIKTVEILNKYNDLFDALFFTDDFCDKYAVLFDRLLSEEQIEIKRYKETDDIVNKLSENIDDLQMSSKLVTSLPCDILFDLYSRYHVLFEYLEDKEFIEVSSTEKKELFIELFNDIWLYGIPTFTHKHF